MTKLFKSVQYVLLLTITLATVFLEAGCKPPVRGPQGEQGPPGPPGTPGTVGGIESYASAYTQGAIFPNTVTNVNFDTLRFAEGINTPNITDFQVQEFGTYLVKWSLFATVAETLESDGTLTLDLMDGGGFFYAPAPLAVQTLPNELLYREYLSGTVILLLPANAIVRLRASVSEFGIGINNPVFSIIRID